jgi:glutamate decarboxylase
VIGTSTHACFSKFARYFDTGVKWVPVQPGQYAVTAEQVRAVLDTDIESDHEVMRECGYLPEEVRGRKMAELVLVVGCVVCTTYTGDMDDVAGIDRVLTEGGWDIPIHVDAASGGFVLPFSREDLKWDFRLAHVQSINTSNHKYGLVYPGLGTLVFRDRTVVPEELIVDIDYLSGESRNFSLNFSRPSAGVVLQYYNFLRLGRSGYRRLIARCLDTAAFLAHEFRTLPTLGRHLEIVTRTDLFPVLAFRIRQSESECAAFTLTELANALREKRGWIVPVYRLPANTERIEVMRVVVRAEMTLDLANLFLDDLVSAIGFFEGAAHV